MAETRMAGDSPPSKTRKTEFFALLALIAAGVAALAAFTDNLGKLGTSGYKLCQFAKLCAADPLPTPVLAGYDSPAMAGGSDPDKQCGPLLDKYRAENPNFDIKLNSWQDHDKDWLGHVTYHYHCRYTALAR